MIYFVNRHASEHIPDDFHARHVGIKNPMNDELKATSVDVPQLIEQWRQGDHDAAEALYNRYQSRLLLLVSGRLSDRLRRRVDPNDLVQSILKSAFRVTSEKDIGCANESGFWKWLVTVALNKTYKRIERERAIKRDLNREVASDSVLGDRIINEPTPDDVVEVSELLQKILEKLSDLQGQILLAKLDGLSQIEIADKLDVSTKTVQRNGQVIREAAMAVLGADVPVWLVDDDLSMTDQFLDCLNEPIANWLPDNPRGFDSGVKANLIDVFKQAEPDLKLLDAIRSHAKAEGYKKQREMPQAFCSAVYLLAVATARVKLDAKISSDSDRTLAKRTEVELKKNWLGSVATKRLQEFLTVLRK